MESSAAAAAQARDDGAALALDHPNAMGAAFLAASASGIIKATGRVQKSARLEAHRRNVQVLESLVFVIPADLQGGAR